MEQEVECPACGSTDECGCIYQCGECDGWHISDLALKRMGITEQDLQQLEGE